MKKKAPKFFCENCGEEVKENAKICTHCGKFFTNIRCPKCFHQGDSREFKNGCPECGYSNNKNNFNQKDENESKKYKPNRIFHLAYIFSILLYYLSLHIFSI